MKRRRPQRFQVLDQVDPYTQKKLRLLRIHLANQEERPRRRARARAITGLVFMALGDSQVLVHQGNVEIEVAP